MTDDAGRKALADEFDGEVKAHRAMGDADEANKCEMAAAALRTSPPATASREAKHVKDICKRLREGGRHSGIIDPLNTDAANLIEVLYLAGLAPPPPSQATGTQKI